MAPDADALRLAEIRDDRTAHERFVREHLPVVRHLAAQYRGLGLSFDDLVQEGSLGLLDAIERFDPQRGLTFDAYSRFRIRRAIRNALTDTSRVIRLPKQVVERRRAVARAAADLTAADGRRPSSDEVAAAVGLSPEAVAAVRDVTTCSVSLDEPRFVDGTALAAELSDAAADDPEHALVTLDEEREIDSLVDELPERQREVVRRHFGFGGRAEQLSSVAASLRISPQRARELERSALASLRQRLDP